MDVYYGPVVKNNYADEARKLVLQVVNNRYKRETSALQKEEPEKKFVAAEIEYEDVKVVWLVKVLEHWKALVTTTTPDGRYYEVTHHGVKNETYVDTYTKEENEVIPD